MYDVVNENENENGEQKENVNKILNILQIYYNGKCYENVRNVMKMLGMLQICYTQSYPHDYHSYPQ